MGSRDPGVTEIAARGITKPKTHILENRNPIRFFFKLYGPLNKYARNRY